MQFLDSTRRVSAFLGAAEEGGTPGDRLPMGKGRAKRDCFLLKRAEK
jgi:hypothetical protein